MNKDMPKRGHFSIAVKNHVLSGLAALVAAPAFHSMRKNMQNFVDKAFYRLRYDYKKSILSFKLDIEAVIPLNFQMTSLFGYLALGRKSQARDTLMRKLNFCFPFLKNSRLILKE
jgi:hypothetical protein